MRVFIAGATGVLGRRLVRQLVEHGQSVVGLARGTAGAEIVRAQGGEPREADLFDVGSLSRAAAGCDVVVHAATSIPVRRRTSPRHWRMNDRIRRKGTQALTRCAEVIEARHYVHQSVIWVASPPDGAAFDEDSPPHVDHITRSALDGEQVARQAGKIAGFSVAILRCGWFYGADAGHTRMLGATLARRQLPIFGRGDAEVACLHLDDAASAFAVSAENAKAGLWHVTDELPVTFREYLTAFADLLGAQPPRTIPIWLARLLAGQEAVKFFTSSMRTTNARFRADFDWAPRYPTFREGLAQIVDSWKEEPFFSAPGSFGRMER